MKKKLLASVLVSSFVLGHLAPLATVEAQDTDSKIANVEKQISSLTTQQAAAQAQVNVLQGKVDAIKAEQDALTAENEKLQVESDKLAVEIADLSKDIVARNEALTAQARSAQTDGTVSSYINTVLDSKSLSDAISRVTAMNEIISANNRMLEQQEADKAAIQEKQKANQEAINTIAANQQKLADDEQALKTQQAELEVAKLHLATELATAEEERNNLHAQKKAAEEAAAKAAAEEAAYRAAQQNRLAALSGSASNAQGTVVANATTVTPDGATSGASASAVVATTVNAAVTPLDNPTVSATVSAPTGPRVTYSANNTYPVGQCTWGVKALAPWVGNYWGNAKDWIASAQAAGYSVGTQPTVGSVAVWPGDGGGYGHVAVVTAVQSPTNIQVSESNYAGNQSIGNYRGWFNPTAGVWGGGSVYYIYP